MGTVPICPHPLPSPKKKPVSQGPKLSGQLTTAPPGSSECPWPPSWTTGTQLSSKWQDTDLVPLDSQVSLFEDRSTLEFQSRESEQGRDSGEAKSRMFKEASILKLLQEHQHSECFPRALNFAPQRPHWPTSAWPWAGEA